MKITPKLMCVQFSRPHCLVVITRNILKEKETIASTISEVNKGEEFAEELAYCVLTLYDCFISNLSTNKLINFEQMSYTFLPGRSHFCLLIRVFEQATFLQHLAYVRRLVCK